jgi:hypothetical protein
LWSYNARASREVKSVRFLLILLVFLLVAGIHSAQEQGGRSLLDIVRESGTDLQPLRRRVGTYTADGRLSLVDLYRAQCELQRDPGWVLEELFREELTLAGGERIALPASCLRTARTGPALWILAGIHGEEPAGPNAVAERLPALAALDRRGIPIVVMPLLNPLGYQRNWRYPDVAIYSERNPGSSVGDSDHLLPDDKGKPRRALAVSRQARSVTTRVVDLARVYPPVLALDLHEDNLLRQGYLYSQGATGANDPAAAAIVAIFRKHGFAILMSGKTRFGETVRDGIVSGVKDGSIDELLSAKEILVGGSRRAGPAGRSILVLETSLMNTPLADRQKVHETILDSLEALWALARTVP